MYDRVCYILAELNCLPLRLQKSAAAYLVFLMLTIKKHDFQSAGKLMECDPSCFCRLLNSDGREQLTRIVLNRAKRRHLQALSQRLGVSLHERNVIIIDATIMGRHGKVENLGKFNHGKGSVKGHMFVNFVYLGADGVSLVPLDSLPLYTKKYARENKLAYRTEAEIVEDWINDLPDAGYFAKEDMPNVLFLMDAGYDVKAIQNAVIGIKAHFVAALKSNRSVEGRNVSQYFRRHRNLAWSTIRLIVGSGGKGSRREYRTRHAKGVRLKGVGQASVVCSERKRSHRKTRKYLATNDPSFSAHDIVFWYSRRWLIGASSQGRVILAGESPAAARRLEAA